MKKEPCSKKGMLTKSDLKLRLKFSQEVRLNLSKDFQI